jgi:integrase
MTDEQTAIIRRDEAPLVLAGQAADKAAASGEFADYRERKAANTLRAQDADLALFARFLELAGAGGGDLLEPEAWRGVSWGIVSGFVRGLVAEGHAIASINRALATIRTYAKLATQAGAVDPQALALIRTVSGYSTKEGKRLDEGREKARTGRKKPEAVSISQTVAAALKSQPETPRGARDALLMCLLLDHGLRVGEVALLHWSDIDAENQHLTFYRPKVDKIQIHKLTGATRCALERYRAYVPFYEGALLRPFNKGGRIQEGGLTESSIARIVRRLGAAAGLEDLSPHDCRHYWATTLTRKGVQIKALQDAGGWSSPAMPLRYAESARIANEGAEVD